MSSCLAIVKYTGLPSKPLQKLSPYSLSLFKSPSRNTGTALAVSLGPVKSSLIPTSSVIKKTLPFVFNKKLLQAFTLNEVRPAQKRIVASAAVFKPFKTYCMFSATALLTKSSCLNSNKQTKKSLTLFGYKNSLNNHLTSIISKNPRNLRQIFCKSSITPHYPLSEDSALLRTSSTDDVLEVHGDGLIACKLQFTISNRKKAKALSKNRSLSLLYKVEMDCASDYLNNWCAGNLMQNSTFSSDYNIKNITETVKANINGIPLEVKLSRSALFASIQKLVGLKKMSIQMQEAIYLQILTRVLFMEYENLQAKNNGYKRIFPVKSVSDPHGLNGLDLARIFEYQGLLLVCPSESFFKPLTSFNQDASAFLEEVAQQGMQLAAQANFDKQQQVLASQTPSLKSQTSKSTGPATSIIFDVGDEAYLSDAPDPKEGEAKATLRLARAAARKKVKDLPENASTEQKDMAEANLKQAEDEFRTLCEQVLNFQQATAEQKIATATSFNNQGNPSQTSAGMQAAQLPNPAQALQQTLMVTPMQQPPSFFNRLPLSFNLLTNSNLPANFKGFRIGSGKLSSFISQNPDDFFTVTLEERTVSYDLFFLKNGQESASSSFQLSYLQNHVQINKCFIKTDLLGYALHSHLLKFIQKIHSPSINYKSLVFETFNCTGWDKNGRFVSKTNVTLLQRLEAFYQFLVGGTNPSENINTTANLLFTPNFYPSNQNFLKPNRFITCPAFMTEAEIKELQNRDLWIKLEKAFSEPIVISENPRIVLYPSFERGNVIELSKEIQFRGIVSNAGNNESFS